MREKLEARLAELRDENEKGQKMLTQMDEERVNLAQTLLRINGAIQVLEEVLQVPPLSAGATNGDTTVAP